MQDTETPAPKPIVLFLCTANAARSQMAEALLRRFAGDTFDARSAGIAPRPIHPLTHRVMSEIGIDTSAQRSKGVREFLGRLPIHTAIIVCAQAQQHCPALYPFALQTLYWPFDDPAAEELDRDEQLVRFRVIRDAIADQLSNWLTTSAGRLQKAPEIQPGARPSQILYAKVPTASKPALTPRLAAQKPAALDDQLDSELFKALADPTRTRLLASLVKCGRPCSVTEVAACCYVDFSVVARHLGLLARAGVLEATKEGRTVWYVARCEDLAARLRALADAIEDSSPPRSDGDAPGRDGAPSN
jgi:arsenate reductase (thioredoxin)